MADGDLDFDFVADDGGVASNEPGVYSGGVSLGGRLGGVTGVQLPDGGFVNPANGRAVRFRRVLMPAGPVEVFVCFDGNPDDGPGTKYHGVNRGLVETREEAELWLRGKWPRCSDTRAGLVFLEGISERLSG
jgi:hypothetical protein